MEGLDGMDAQPGPWIVEFGPENSRTVGRFGQVLELVLQGKIGRDALLHEPSGRSCLVRDVPGLAILFEDERLRRFLLQQRRATEPACLPKALGLQILSTLARLVRGKARGRPVNHA
jgi:hypothetical protein